MLHLMKAGSRLNAITQCKQEDFGSSEAKQKYEMCNHSGAVHVRNVSITNPPRDFLALLAFSSWILHQKCKVG